MSRRASQPDWMAWIRVGDVLTRNGRTYRVVRSVSRRTDGRLSGVTFTIKHRSWTGRPDTTYLAQDLKTLGFRPVGARIRLASELDQRLASYRLTHASRGGPFPVTPEDVRGVA